MRSRQSTSIAGSPILIGVVTVLVTFVAVFLAYNANSGLPFVPTYRVTVEVPDAAGLVEGNEVRVGGKRVGTIERIVGRVGAAHPYARLELKLDKTLQPLRGDSQVTVRPRSPLGLKYLELAPGRRGRAIAERGILPLARARGSVELDQVINTFDAQTRYWGKRALDQAGPGLAGRGVDFNEVIRSSPELLLHLERVAANLGSRRTGLRGMLRALERVAVELAPVAPQLASLVDGADRTLAALASVSPQLAAVMSGLPPTELEATRTLVVARPVLRDVRALARALWPGIRFLKPATGRLHAALQTGIPVLRDTRVLWDRLDPVLRELLSISSDPVVRDALARLRPTLDSALPTLRFVAPVQTRCNYVPVYLRNIASTVSEGDAAGTWLRTLVIGNPGQEKAQASPTADLHANPYPFTAAPGQHGLCEAGNEPYTPGRHIGHAPGARATYTENIGTPGGASR
jgi:virulence factor Mce-like protein